MLLCSWNKYLESSSYSKASYTDDGTICWHISYQVNSSILSVKHSFTTDQVSRAKKCTRWSHPPRKKTDIIFWLQVDTRNTTIFFSYSLITKLLWRHSPNSLSVHICKQVRHVRSFTFLSVLSHYGEISVRSPQPSWLFTSELLLEAHSTVKREEKESCVSASTVLVVLKIFLSPFCFLAVLGMEPRVLHMLGKRFSPELHPQPSSLPWIYF